ncbi:hypothetical protein [Kribbella sp. CA-293567]|uniref:hypothetical protein n=1 Tax=Kribbella sp. CA-293567 TaxID=3002436 RepID=UPI0022DE32E1|nr:hypothetical protein [Kribbella sp. CA-293567]WBQ03501.1 hypothetical protein OX958_26440 [Kribbella sp. CA-293567]
MPKRGLFAVVLLLTSALASCSDVPASLPATEQLAAPSTPSTPPLSPTPTPKPQPQPKAAELPRGGRQLFPAHQLVAFVGAPGSPALGPLDRDLDVRVRRLERLGASYRDGRTVLPVMELIVVTAQAAPGRDGKYRSRIDPAQIDKYLAVARRHKALLMLDVQPGQAKPLAEIRRLEPWLKQPDVGLAVDPEWEVGPGQVPGQVFGRTSGAELNAIGAYLSGLVTEHKLPEKLFVFHQLSKPIVRDEAALRTHPGVATVKSVDGIGTREQKIATYNGLTKGLPKGIRSGFKLFYSEDTRHGPLMTPAQVLAVRPRPDLVIYE